MCCRSRFALTQRPKAVFPGCHGLGLPCGPPHSLTFQEPRPQIREPSGVSGHGKEQLHQPAGDPSRSRPPPRSKPPPEAAPRAQPSVQEFSQRPATSPPHQEAAPRLYFSSTAAPPFTRRFFRETENQAKGSRMAVRTEAVPGLTLRRRPRQRRALRRQTAPRD